MREQLVETGDASATFQNIADAKTLVRLAIVAFIGAFVLDVLVAWALYHVFRPAGAALASLTAWFRIVYTVFLGAAVVFLFAVLRLVRSENYVASLDQPAREAHTMLALDAFNATWLIGLACFGVHLAARWCRSSCAQRAPRALGVVLLIAGAAYVFDTLAYSMLSSYADHESIFSAMVAVPAVVAESAFMIWLLRRAGRQDAPPTSEMHSDVLAAV